MAIKPRPDGYHTVTPYLVVPGVAKLIDFLKAAFGAEEIARMPAPGGRIGHAEVRIGDSRVMMGDAGEEHPPIPAMLYLYVDDVDAIYQRALSAGAESIEAPANQFYGDRRAGVKDAGGNLWYLATHVEEVSPDEVKRRAQEMMQKAGG